MLKRGLIRQILILALAAGVYVTPAQAATSQSGAIVGSEYAPSFNVGCRPGGVLVGVNGKSSRYVDSVQPVCVNTTGSKWTTATYVGAVAGTGGVTAFSRVCPANTVVKSISGRSASWVEQITISCQGLSEVGEYTGPVTTLPPAGGAGGVARAAVSCVLEQPASGLYGSAGPNGPMGIWGNSVHSIGLNCATRMEGLKQVAVPTPSNLAAFVADKNAAIVLGKALFWERQIGSDSVQSCASCHFHAGADNRSKNQINPGLARAASPTTANPDTSFQIGGPNFQLTAANFPLFQRSNPDDPNSAITRDVNDVVSSQGVFNSIFVSAPPAQYWDNVLLRPDSVFNVGGTPTRRVAARNAPTTINAVFNFRNFWDGRAQFLFNGVNPFGPRDPNARVFRNIGGTVSPVQVRIDNASLASQAVGPPSSNFEMSADGRTLMDIAKRILTARPLALQRVAADDSVLGPYINTPPYPGLRFGSYVELIQAAFRPEWWNGPQAVEVGAGGSRRVIPAPATLAANQYTQMQANFSLFFGLAIQLYEATLVGDDTPFDRYMAGNATALSPDQLAGMSLFNGKGKCGNCHKGAEFTGASVRRTINQPLERMIMGNGGTAVYDQGFYNIGVTRTLDDILVGGRDAYGLPLSNTAIAQKFGSAGFQQLIGISPNLTVASGERIAVMGAAKTPTVRNVELTQSFFHNGGALNFRQLLELYNRGGNFKSNNFADLDPDITTLGLSQTEKNQIVAFMKSLTDDRVRRDAAPFDHPELLLSNGHTGTNVSVVPTYGHAQDAHVTLPAVGRNGTAGPARPNFLGVVE